MWGEITEIGQIVGGRGFQAVQLSVCGIMVAGSGGVDAGYANIITDRANNTIDNANIVTDGANNTTDNANNVTDGANNTTDNANIITDRANNTTDSANNVTDGANNTSDSANFITDCGVCASCQAGHNPNGVLA